MWCGFHEVNGEMLSYIELINTDYLVEGSGNVVIICAKGLILQCPIFQLETVFNCIS